MADLFLSYSRSDRARAATVADALEAGGRTLWWDGQLGPGEDYESVIEREIAAADCVVVAWSRSARESLWVRAEANEALDQDKLVQVNLDGSKPPLPFNMLHAVDLGEWSGERSALPWPEIESQISQRLGADGGARRPDPGGIPWAERREGPLQGFGRVAALGWAGLGIAILLMLTMLLAARGLISAAAFGTISFGAAGVAALLLAATAFLFLRIQMASRT